MSRPFMNMFVFVTVVASMQAPAQPQAPVQPQNPSKCSLTPAQAPTIRGIKLGMSTEEILSLFPESNQRPDIKAELVQADGYPNYGVARFYFRLSDYPSVAKDRFAGIDGISVTLFDGRVAELGVHYAGPNSRPRGPFWLNVDDFIAKLSKAYALPDARDWPLGSQTDKWLKCNGLDIEANVSQNGGSIILRSTAFMDIRRERAATDEENLRREFKP
jgi:hypothetical protein